jgi:oligopeptide transport system ATP-binding protein
MPPLLDVQNLVRHFPLRRGLVFAREIGRVRAVDGVSFALHRGETLAVVGESGCGKSTLARLVLRLIEPTGGAVRFDGTDMLALDKEALRALRRRMQIIFQDPFASLNPRLSVRRILAEPLELHLRLDRKAIDARVHELLSVVGLSPYHAERFPHEFSGGQRQRIAIARAILKDAPLLLLDEATSSLDAESERVVQGALDTAMRGRTTIVIAHRLATVQRADRIFVLDHGRIVEQGRHAELITRGALYARLAALQFAA